jgi:tetratricopeptide (TPR) repeat protein
VSAGTRIRKARLQRGLTQAELAGEEYSAAYVSIIESGKREPSERVLKAFAKALGITFEELATGRPPDAEAALGQELISARQLLSAGTSDAALATYRRVAKRAAQYGLTRLQGKAAVGEALCRELDGDLEDALVLYERLFETTTEEDVVTKADAAAGRARCLRMLGDVPYSIYVLEGYLSHLERTRLLDPDALSRIHITLVASYFEAGMVHQAASAAQKALQLSAKVSDEEKIADMHINLARVLLERGNYAGAAKAFDMAEDLFRRAGLQVEIGRAHLARAFLMKRQERHGEAISDLEEALRIFEDTGNEMNHVRALSELGGLQRVMGRHDQAVFTLERAARMASKNQPASAAISYRELALCYVELGQPAKVRSSFKRAIQLLESSGDKYELAVTYRAWGDALRDEKDYQKACDAYRSAAIALEAA